MEWRYDSTGTYDARYYYTYDGNGNIVSETVDGKRTTYVYDSANQLIRENNQRANRTWTWTYDAAGNIQNKKEYTYTTGTLGNPLDVVTYTYGNSTWGDLLTVYGGVALTYDDIGNLISYGPRSYTWTQGRQLASMSNGTTTWTYAYDANGMRTSRTNGTTTYNYVYSGSQLSWMTIGTTELQFSYDANGRPLAVVYNGILYYYALNLQGDVVAILNMDGNPVVYYTYDAWGKLLSTTGSLASTLGTLNPLRYRGYVYDSETGLYYLQSRYYNPEWGRFINADVFVSTGQGLLGNNMFAYCRNNPVKRIDITGTADLCVTQNENDSNPLNDLATIGKGSISGNSNSGNQSVANGGISNAVYGNSRNGVPDGSIGAGRTEIHHIVEQCQRYKSGFSNAAIQDASNKVALPYSVHRQISGYYSSKPKELGGLRVRDWLAGQSFEAQTAFGWRVINMFSYRQCN